MTYVRVSTMRPALGSEAEVEKLNKELIAFYREQDGCLSSTYIKSADASGEVGRVTFWESDTKADRAALLERSIYLRSRLHLLIQKGHEDRSFQAETATEAAALAGSF